MPAALRWPASFVVARAYLDQLARDKALPPAKLSALKSAIDRADKKKPGKDTLDALETLTRQLDADAAAINSPDAAKMRTLAATLRVRIGELR